MKERKLQHFTILVATVFAVSAFAFLWSLAGEGETLLSLLAFNGLFLLGACLLCLRLGRGGASADPAGADEETASLLQSRLQRCLGDEPGENR